MRSFPVRQRTIFSGLAVCLLGSGFLAFGAFQIGDESNELSIHILDVGQGDAIYIRTPFHQSIVIDGGPDGRAAQKLSHLLPLFDRSIDLLILTHPHADHVRGLIPILGRFSVKRIGTSGRTHTTPEFDAFESEIRSQGIPEEALWHGRRIVFGADLFFDILAPLRDERTAQDDDLNNSSVVGILTFEHHRILLMGDAGEPVERELLLRSLVSSADTIKVGHHGSKYASTAAFLSLVQPKSAIISSGADNDYGHPHAETLDRLAASHTRVYRTDQQGDVTIRIRRGKLDIRAQR